MAEERGRAPLETDSVVGEESEEEVESLAARKANGASLLIIASRITGFGRTMAQANALSGGFVQSTGQ